MSLLNAGRNARIPRLGQTPGWIEGDKISPTCVLSSSSSDPVYASFSVTATFSEDVISFAIGDITVTNGSASNFAGSGAVYTFDVTPTDPGSVTVQILAGVCTDAAGNPNTASNILSRDADYVAMTIVTTSSPQTITLNRITPTGTDCVLTWGDGNSTTITDGNTGSTAHEYATAGTYQIAISNPEIITYIDIGLQPISEIDVSLCTALVILRCNNTNLSALDVSNNVLLDTLRCNTTSISSLDLTNNTMLTVLWFNTTPISEIDVSNNTMLITIRGQATNITTIDTSNNVDLTALWVYSCSNLTSIDVTNNIDLTDLQYQDCGLTQVQHDAIIDSIWTMTQTRTPADGTGTINGGGTNTDPSGTYQPASGCPPTDELERVWEMLFDTCGVGFNKWASFTY